ncbi:MAG TPA: Dickkopf N-terminal cysteine-rich domain-containing protein [Kofleriaceae bacterium]|jgi:hypothetical protein
MGHARFAVIAALFAHLTACGGGDGGIKATDFQAAELDAQCERLVRCGLFSNQDACKGTLVNTFDRDVLPGIDAKKVKFDGGKAQECIDALATTSCDVTTKEFREQPAACQAILTGTVADGQPCEIEAECISGTCDQPLCARESCCEGTCAATLVDAPAGAACMFDANCADALFCDKTDHTCHALVAAAGDCAGDNECKYGTACIGATDLQKGKCRALPAIGEACPYMLCADAGATCTNGTCVAFALAPAACPMGTECSPFSRCVNGACVELPVLGEACEDRCQNGSWCNAGTCVGPRADGDACDNDDECPERFCAEGPVFDACAMPPVCD